MKWNDDCAVLRCENLRKSFFIRNKEFPVLTGVSLDVMKGEIVLIEGRSGAGKTTFISLLGGLESATSGVILWQGKRLGTIDGEDWATLRKKKAGIIFQDYNLITSWTAYENVEAPLLFGETLDSDRRSQVHRLMKQLDIQSLADNKPAEMSEGQQQRVAVARAIVTEPMLILADEPTGGVDPETGGVIMSTLLSLVKKKDASLLITTHGGSALRNIADRVFLLDKGTLRPD